MRLIIVFLSGLIAGAASFGFLRASTSPTTAQASVANDETDNGVDGWNEMQRTSYGIGYGLSYEVVAGLKFDEVQVDPAALAQGFSDGVHGRPATIDARRLEQLMAKLHREVAQRAAARLKAANPEFATMCKQKLAACEIFCTDHRAQPNVQAFDNGILYKVIESGSGKSPGPDDLVVISCRMTRTDGTVVLEDESAEVYMDTVVDGGRYVLSRMKVGDHWQVVLPPHLAHGEAGKSPLIGPNETIICDVKLLEVK